MVVNEVVSKSELVNVVGWMPYNSGVYQRGRRLCEQCVHWNHTCIEWQPRGDLTTSIC